MSNENDKANEKPASADFDNEMILSTASRILEEHRAAFLELAK